MRNPWVVLGILALLLWSSGKDTLQELLPPSFVETAPEEEAHGPMYIPGVSAEDAYIYFEEVCLDSEFHSGGNPNLVQKWTEPISYVVMGDYTQEDLQILTSFTEELNQVSGFPGILETENTSEANLKIYFCSQEELLQRMGDDYYNADGAVKYWYNGDNEIYEAIICCRSDIDQYVRNSVIQEEIFNGLGPIQDTYLRPESIAYQEYSTPQHLSPEDWLMLQLLYHSEILCGMEAEECERVIHSIYY